MPAPPLLRPREVIRAFERLGWQHTRQRGSHIVLTRTGSQASLCVPNHSLVARGTLRALLAKAGVKLETFLNALA